MTAGEVGIGHCRREAMAQSTAKLPERRAS